jgi:hypothetical protein
MGFPRNYTIYHTKKFLYLVFEFGYDRHATPQKRTISSYRKSYIAYKDRRWDSRLGNPSID